MAYDTDRNRVVIFGGLDQSLNRLADTWDWDGTSWTQAGGSSPQARHEHAMAYDHECNRMVVFGGSNAPNGAAPYFGDTWEYAQTPFDSDSDGVCDTNDACPNDPNKVSPGACGCGVIDSDSDNDGTADCNDLCPGDANKINAGQCGCGISDIDSDGDGTANCNDSCPADSNKIAPGVCGCGLSDAIGFVGFLPPIGGADATGGNFADPVRAFKLGSTIPVKFSASHCAAPLLSGIHTLQAVKFSNAVDSEPAIDATPTDAATTGNQFRLSGGEWHFNLSTQTGFSMGTWKLIATMSDGSTHYVWISIKK